MSQRYLQQLRSSVQSTKDAAINAIKSQLHYANDGSFILGRYLDGKNGVRTIIGVNAYTDNGKNITIYEFDGIEFEALQERITELEETIGVGEGTKSITDRVKELEQIISNLTSDKTNTNSIAYKIYESELKLVGDKYVDTDESNTIEGAKKYADKTLEKELSEGGKIHSAIIEASKASTTKVAVGTDPNNIMSISSKTNVDGSITYEISLEDIAIQSELDEVKEFIGMVEGDEGSDSIIERIEKVDNRITNEVNTLNEKIQKNTDSITILNGNGEGSIQKTVSDAITELVNGADEKFDTLKEISDYILNDTTNAAKITSDISDLKKSVNALSKVNVVSCDASDLIKVGTSITYNNDSKEEKTFTICPNNIASLTDLDNTKTEFNNKLSNINEKINKEVTDRQTADNSLQSYINQELTVVETEIDNIESKISILMGNDSSSIAGQIDAAIKKIKGDATINGDNLGALEDRIEQIESDVNMEGGHVDTLIKTSIEALDYTDAPKLNEFVYGVNQENGIINVTRINFSEAVVTSDGKSLATVINELKNNITSAETSANAAATKIVVSGNDILTKTETKDEINGSTTYNINLGYTWDCGVFTYVEPTENNEENNQ